MKKSPTRSRVLIRFGIGVLLGASLAACSKSQPEAEPVTPVQVAPAVRGRIRQMVTADAVLYPRDQANIMPKVSAPVRRYLVTRGDHVKAGQLLAELDNRDLVAAAAASQGQLEQAQSNYRSTTGAAVPEQVTKAQTDVEAARAGLDAAQTLLDGRTELLKQGALARKLVDEAQVAYAQAKAQFDSADQHLKSLMSVGRSEQIKSAEGQRNTARGQLDAAQAQVAYSEIRSPITGVVTDRPLYTGEVANTGTPLVTVMDVSAVVARVNLPQEQARIIKVGAAAMLTPPEGGDPVPATVTVVSPAVDANSTTVQVWVQADNPGERFRVGTSVHVAIVAATIDAATIIPAAAVLPSDEGGVKVMVVDDKNIAHEKKIMTGAADGDLVQVTSGLEPGERVVTVGGLGLDDKAKVTVVKPTEKSASDDDKKDDEAGK
jgi:multidrug efflux pump subunit AcrA (membrane-fusion protein)